jgi:hypothetical protein
MKVAFSEFLIDGIEKTPGDAVLFAKTKYFYI